MIPVGTNLRLKRIPLTTVSLILVNWVIFIFLRWDYYKTYFWAQQYLFSVPGEQYPWQLVTSMFLHDGFWHILGNSYFLYVFGIFVEDKIGWKAYLFLYFFTGIGANLVHGIMVGLFMRDSLFIPSLGASGAVSGIMGVYLYRCYYSKIKLIISLWIPIRIQIPAVVVLGLWFLKDLVGGIDSIRGMYQNVAFWAHIGGFAFGLAACKYLKYGIEARKEKTQFIADTKTDRAVGYGEGIAACEKLLEEEPKNSGLHLKLARAKSRRRASEAGRRHYETAIKLLLRADAKQAAEIFAEYWAQYLRVMEPRFQVLLSRLIYKHVDPDLSAKTLQTLIEGNEPSDQAMEEAHLDLAAIYGRLGRGDLARYVYGLFLKRFPTSRYRQFAEKKLGAITRMTAVQG